MTFETFDGHSGVAFSLAAAQKVAGQPGMLYSPLYFFGPSGVGKTHLLQAIGHALRKSRPELTVIYVTASDFSDELVQVMMHRKIDAFRERYRLTCDVLLLDNLQDLAHRERTQEEVFYTFVKLRERGCQIIAAGDRYPKDLPNLPDRLKSRFDQGLVADLQPPDTDGKVRILKRIVDTEGVHVPDGILRYIIHRSPADLHGLAGALRRVIALAIFHEVAVDRSTVDQYLEGYLPDVQRGDPEAIITAVGKFFNVKVADLKGPRRIKQLVIPRHLAMYLIRTNTELSLPQIGGRFGGRDHTTVISAIRKIQGLLQTDSFVRRQAETIADELGLSIGISDS